MFTFGCFRFDASNHLIVLVYYSLNSSFMKFFIGFIQTAFNTPHCLYNFIKAKLFEEYLDVGMFDTVVLAIFEY